MKKTFFMLAALTFAVCAEAEFRVTQGDQVAIVVPPNASGLVQFASKDLQHFLALRTGAECRIVDRDPVSGKKIRLGLKKHAPCDSDAFSIEVSGDTVDIYGCDSGDPASGPVYMLYYHRFHGTACGVYEFLDRWCGVRFIVPGPLGEIVPQRGTISAPDGKLERKSVFRERHARQYYRDRERPDSSIYHGTKEDSGTALAVWGLRNQVSSRCFGTHGCHTATGLKLREAFGKEHPEWFSLQRDGTRGDTLCWHAEGLEKMWTRIASAYLEGKAPSAAGLTVKVWPYGMKHSQPDEFMIDCGDEWDRYGCVCEKCRTGNLNDRIYKVIFAVAEEIAKKYPGKKISTLSYPPKPWVPHGMKVPENFRCRVCHEGPSVMSLPRNTDRDAYLGLVKDWSKVQNRKIGVWTYLFGNIENRMPGIPETSPENFQAFLRNIAPWCDGVYLEYYGQTETQVLFDQYLYQRLLWDPELDLEAAMHQLADDAYGAAAGPMLKFHKRLSELWRRNLSENWDEGPSGGGAWPSSGWTGWKKLPLLMGNFKKPQAAISAYRKIYTEAEITRLESMLDEASKLVPPESREHSRIALQKKWVLEWMRAQRKLALVDEQWLKVRSLRVAVNASSRPSEEVLIPCIKPMETPPPLKGDTRFRISADAKELTVTADLDDPNPDRMQSVKRGAENLAGIWKDNDVELFFWNGRNIVQFVVNDRGDSALFIDGACKGKPAVKAQTARRAGGWTMTVKIPHALTGILPGIKGDYRFNMLRCRVTAGEQTEYSSWVPVPLDRNRNINFWGDFQLGTETAAGSVPGSDSAEYSLQAQAAGMRKFAPVSKSGFDTAKTPGWRTWSAPKKEPILRYEAKVGHDAPGSLFTERAAKQNGCWTYKFDTAPNTRIRIEAFAMAPESAGRTAVSLRWRNGKGQYVGYEKFGGDVSIPATGKFEKLAFEVTAPGRPEIAGALLTFTTTKPGKLWIDDVTVSAELEADGAMPAFPSFGLQARPVGKAAGKAVAEYDFAAQENPGWRTWSLPGKAPKFSHDAAHGAEAVGALSIQQTAVQSGCWILPLKVRPGANLRISAMLCGSAAETRGSMEIHWRDAQNRWVDFEKSGGNVSINLSTTFRPIGMEVTVPNRPEITNAFVTFGIGGADRLLIDDVKVEELP